MEWYFYLIIGLLFTILYFVIQLVRLGMIHTGNQHGIYRQIMKMNEFVEGLHVKEHDRIRKLGRWFRR
jgi:hypothetical protein